jgi:putative ABC transport system permease protein
MNLWLEDYQFKIELSWHIFLSAGAFAAVIAILLISFQSIKAALMNPVESLRSE